jgi:hydroxyacylglutathione hydrolase
VIPEGLYLLSLIVGAADTNCYIVGDASTGDVVIIDPADAAGEIIRIVESDKLTVRGIINTHCHADHIGGDEALRTHFGQPIMIHEYDAEGLLDPAINLSALIGLMHGLSKPADRLLAEGDEIAVGGLRLRVLHTLGHTPGGISLLCGGVLFSGDTLFADSIGRTDFPGGSHQQLLKSIREKLLVLPDDTMVFPGHGPQTTIGRERQANPYL